MHLDTNPVSSHLLHRQGSVGSWIVTWVVFTQEGDSPPDGCPGWKEKPGTQRKCSRKSVLFGSLSKNHHVLEQKPWRNQILLRLCSPHTETQQWHRISLGNVWNLAVQVVLLKIDGSFRKTLIYISVHLRGKVSINWWKYIRIKYIKLMDVSAIRLFVSHEKLHQFPCVSTCYSNGRFVPLTSNLSTSPLNIFRQILISCVLFSFFFYVFFALFSMFSWSLSFPQFRWVFSLPPSFVLRSLNGFFLSHSVLGVPMGDSHTRTLAEKKISSTQTPDPHSFGLLCGSLRGTHCLSEFIEFWCRMLYVLWSDLSSGGGSPSCWAEMFKEWIGGVEA